MGKFKKMMEVTSNAGYTGDEGEPDTGFIRGKKERTLGKLSGKPEPWYERGGYSQVDFPEADFIYGEGEEEDYAVRKTAYVAQIDKDFEAHFEKWEDWVSGENFDEQNTVELDESTTSTNSPGPKGYTAFIKDPKEFKKRNKSMASFYKKAMGYLLVERVDYQDTAQQMLKNYGLKSKIKMGNGKNFGEYIPETDTITLRTSYKTYKEFLMTILHEIGHALDADNLGIRKFMKKYTQAGTMAAYDGLDPHDDNKWEEKAEKFARKEIKKYLYKK
jgi:hypothetical protein|tara:strand:+ start:3925 stop:4746 length:822 start_codon:yes stop_codon:yes gene_type:complete